MPPKPEEIQWSELSNIYTPSKLLKEYGETESLPVIVKVIKGHHGENAVDSIDTDQVLLVTAFESQRRVLARDRHGRLISMPEQWPVKFRVRETGVKRSKPKSLQEIFRDYRHKLPVNAYFDKLPKWSFKTGKKAKTNLKYGGVEILNVYTEVFMKAMPIYDGSISVYERELVTLPLYVLVHMQLAEGLVESNQAEWTKVKDKYMEEVKHIDFSKVHGTSDVLLYDHRFYMFYEALKKEVHLEEMSFHFTMPADYMTPGGHVTTSHVTKDLDRINRNKEDDDKNNNTPVMGDSRHFAVEEIPTVKVTESSQEHTVETGQGNHHMTNRVDHVTNSEYHMTRHQDATDSQNLNSAVPAVVSKETVTSQKGEVAKSEESSLHGELVDRQTEVDEDGRQTTVSIQVVNAEEEHYHSTDSGIQTNSPQHASPQHRPPQTTIIDLNANTHPASPQRQHCTSPAVRLRQDEQITYPRGHLHPDEPLLTGGPHVSKVVWVEPTQRAPGYPSEQPREMRFHTGRTGSQSDEFVGMSQSYTDVRMQPQQGRPNQNVYYLRSDGPAQQQPMSSSGSVQDYPVKYLMSGSNPSMTRTPRPSYPSSSSSVFYSLKKNEPVDMRDTVSDIGLSPSHRRVATHYDALHVDIPDGGSHTYAGNHHRAADRHAFDRYYNVNSDAYLLGQARPNARAAAKQRSHSAKRPHDLVPRQQVYVLDRRDNQNLDPASPPAHFNRRKTHHTKSSGVHFSESPRRSPVRVVHTTRGRQPDRSSSFVDVITGKIVRKRSSAGDEVDSNFEFRSLDRGNRIKTSGQWREVPITHSDDEDEDSEMMHSSRNPYDRYRSPERRRQYTTATRQQQEPLIKVHGLGVEMVPPGYASHSYQGKPDSDSHVEVREETIVPKKKKGKKFDPAPLAPQETSGVSSSESEDEITVERGTYTSTVTIDGEYSSKTSTDSFSPKESSHTSAMSPSSADQFTLGSVSPPMSLPEPVPPAPPLTPTKSYRTTHTVLTTDRGSHSETIHSQTMEEITQTVGLQAIQDHTDAASLESGKLATVTTEVHIPSETKSVVMREKKTKGDAKKRSSTNSLRQVYTEGRDSTGDSNIGLTMVSTEDPAFQEVLNSPAVKITGESLKGTTRSSGYGSISSKTEEHKVVKRSKSPHIHQHEDYNNVGSNYEYAVRDSILSIKELDEFLKTQATVDSDSESMKEPDVQISRL